MLMPCLIPIVSLTYLSKLWYLFILLLDIASLAELVDALALGASTERYGSSSLPARTNQISITFHYGKRNVTMQVHVEDISSVQKKITIEIPAEQVNEEIEKAYSAIQKKAKIQGFRPGKAPMQLIKRTYSDAMRDDVMRRLYQQTLYKAMDEHKVEPIDSPTIESDILEPGAPFKYSAIFEVMPQILLKEYTGLIVNKEKYVFKPENIDGELKRMQENMAQMIPLDEDAAVENGHTVSVDYTVEVEGSPEENSGDQTAEVEVGTNRLLPGFEEQLIGMKYGESKKFTLELPANADQPE